MPLYCSAMGKIYMAFGHQDYVASYWESHQEQIQPLTRNTITELSAMYDELADIREHSLAMDKEENELGVSCIAVPVFDIHGRVPYAISISLSTSRMKQVGEKNLFKPLRETAEAISANWALPCAARSGKKPDRVANATNLAPFPCLIKALARTSLALCGFKRAGGVKR
jgi:DNA-binding IclR family transcriptional regulator